MKTLVHDSESVSTCQSRSLPNSFLMTLRIFLWSNFLGMPWTVVKVLRPLRSAMHVSKIRGWRSDDSAHTVDGARRRGLEGETYAECGYGCRIPGFAWFVLRPRRRRRRDLYSASVSNASKDVTRHDGMHGVRRSRAESCLRQTLEQPRRRLIADSHGYTYRWS